MLLLLAFGLSLAVASAVPVKRGAEKDHGIDIYSFHIKSVVQSRYAMTVITSRVANLANESLEVNFHVEIPKKAFISKFSMTMDGKTYDGIVKEKVKAQEQYVQAVSRGQSAGLVSAVGRTLEEFKTSVTVAAHSKVTFELTYEELLKRRLGQYELLIKAHPTQVVKDFKIEVQIREKQGIRFLETSGKLASKDLAKVVSTTLSDKEAKVKFAPTRQQQQQCSACGENGINGDLLIIYDVNRPKSKGDLQVLQGYFVHYFAPSDLPRLPKNVVFIIDQSGSMIGRKMQQTREALLQILDDISEEDHFGLIIFNGAVYKWRSNLVPATSQNLQAARSFVREIKERGATDINAAVLEGVAMLNNLAKTHDTQDSNSILILLTDGDPTSGVTNLGTIQANVKEAIGKRYSLYCLGFGFDVNYEFLEKMALENEGVARRIYPDSDAALQLQGFYEEVATPLLLDVQMNYQGVSNLTQSNFSQYYNGTEIVVAGQITDNDLETFTGTIRARSKNKEILYQDMAVKEDSIMDLYIFGMYIQRLWAYLTVQQLLEKEVLVGPSEKEAVRKEAQELSLKYSFVTPLTSMVVTKPQGEDSQVLHKPKEGKPPHQDDTIQLMSGPPGPMGPPGYPILHGPPGPLGPLESPGYPIPDAPGRSAGYPIPDVPGRSAARGKSVVPGRPPARGKRPGMPGPPVQMDYYSGVLSATNYMTHKDVGTPQLPKILGVVLRVLQPTEGHSLPLCFDVPVSYEENYKLLEDLRADLLMVGQVETGAKKGFQKINIYSKAWGNVTVDTTTIFLKQQDNLVFISWTAFPYSDPSTGVVLLNQEGVLELVLGETRINILLHKEVQESFLWPAIKQLSPDTTATGILGQFHISYEEKQVTPSAILEIQGKQVNASRDTAVNYYVTSAPTVDCWLLPYQSVLGVNLSDLTVARS